MEIDSFEISQIKIKSGTALNFFLSRIVEPFSGECKMLSLGRDRKHQNDSPDSSDLRSAE
jgi:hypothetical protein